MADSQVMAPERVVAAARAWIGTPYHHQASMRGVGADCLGLVRGVWRDLLGNEPEKPPAYTPDWAEALRRETLLEAAARNLIAAPHGEVVPGAALVFRFARRLPAKHIGIATACDRFIHAIEGASVCEVALVPWWRRRIAGVFLFPEG